MRILLANKFYYRRGGDCIYMLNLEQLLKEHGHEVAFFAMDYPENLNTSWKKYFVSNMTGLKPLTRPFGDSETKRKFTQLIDAFKGIRSPMIETTNGWFPDTHSRYFTEDFGYGLKFIYQLNIEKKLISQNINHVYKWGCKYISPGCEDLNVRKENKIRTMIQSKEDLREYIRQDTERMGGKPKLKDWILHNEKW